MILTDDQDRYLSDSSWVQAAVGEPAEIVATQDWGPLTERRVALPSGLEIEFGFAPQTWALTHPVEGGVVSHLRCKSGRAQAPRESVYAAVVTASVDSVGTSSTMVGLKS